METNNSKLVYDILKPQFKQIENMLKTQFPVLWEKYQKLPYNKKIAMCDIIAIKMGL